MSTPFLETRVCRECKIEKQLSDFRTKYKGKKQKETLCKKCANQKQNAKRKERLQNDPIYLERRRELARNSSRKRRNNKENYSKILLSDLKNQDKRKNRDNDLDLEFVNELFQRSCSYCGDAEAQKSLDRIDNSLGHIKNNVNISCVRCNLVRGQMPIAAWEVVAKGMRIAREAGLFGDWDGNILSRNKK